MLQMFLSFSAVPLFVAYTN